MKNNFSFLPDPQEQSYLDFVLATTLSESEACWDALDFDMEFSNHNMGIYRLLPLVFYQLDRFSIQTKWKLPLQHIYFEAWGKNETLFKRFSVIQKSLVENQLAHMLLKGYVLIQKYYKDKALRPMGDIDIFMIEGTFSVALDLFYKQGYRDMVEYNDAVQMHHAYALVNGQGEEAFDLHWQFMPGAIKIKLNSMVWENSVLISDENKFSFFPAATELLFHTCMHGLFPSTISSIRWIPDSVYLLRTDFDKIDWHRFMFMANQTDISFFLGQQLQYLKSKYEIPIPKSVIQNLNEIDRKRLFMHTFFYFITKKYRFSFIKFFQHEGLNYYLSAINTLGTGFYFYLRFTILYVLYRIKKLIRKRLSL